MRKERKHIRLRNFDYSSEGAYFITICTKNREHFFGQIENDKIIFNEIGKIANKCLNDIPHHFLNVEMDEFIVMPNHVHCILVLRTTIAVRAQHVVPQQNDNKISVGTQHVVPLQNDNNISVRPQQVVSQQVLPPQFNQFSKPIPGSVSVIIQQYKSSVKRWCNKNNYEYFQWQTRFHDHVIRNAKEYEKIKLYIISNPMNWQNDKLY